jgi:transcriptional regulator with XRE-family HTH domain
MPPRNPTRLLTSESALAQRIAYERERRGWSYEGLARRMTAAGCPINQSALYKIEKGTKGKNGEPGPPRRITVDELLGFSRVFEQSIESLLLPTAAALSEEFAQLLHDWDDAAVEARSASAKAGDARSRELRAFERMREYVRTHPEVEESAKGLMEEWTEIRGLDEAQRPNIDPLLTLLFGEDARTREQYLRQPPPENDGGLGRG